MPKYKVGDRITFLNQEDTYLFEIHSISGDQQYYNIRVVKYNASPMLINTVITERVLSVDLDSSYTLVFKEHPAVQEKHKCCCPWRDLYANGCKCGGI
jgi:hypothetical protein